MEAGAAFSGLEETKVSIAFHEDNTFQGKDWIFDSASTVHVCFQKELFKLLGYKRGRDCQDSGWLSLRGHRHWDNQDYKMRWDNVCSVGSPVCPEGTLQSNIHMGARQKRMSDPSAIRRRHS